MVAEVVADVLHGGVNLVLGTRQPGNDLGDLSWVDLDEFHLGASVAGHGVVGLRLCSAVAFLPNGVVGPAYVVVETQDLVGQNGAPFPVRLGTICCLAARLPEKVVVDDVARSLGDHGATVARGEVACDCQTLGLVPSL